MPEHFFQSKENDNLENFRLEILNLKSQEAAKKEKKEKQYDVHFEGISPECLDEDDMRAHEKYRNGTILRDDFADYDEITEAKIRLSKEKLRSANKEEKSYLERFISTKKNFRAWLTNKVNIKFMEEQLEEIERKRNKIS